MPAIADDPNGLINACETGPHVATGVRAENSLLRPLPGTCAVSPVRLWQPCGTTCGRTMSAKSANSPGCGAIGLPLWVIALIAELPGRRTANRRLTKVTTTPVSRSGSHPGRSPDEVPAGSGTDSDRKCWVVATSTTFPSGSCCRTHAGKNQARHLRWGR